ncbi:cellulose binding domain-containing protein [Actinoplanes sp. NPDC049599]|uniref:cellulose binding domain-containing protein n=1 Tax=Actinoplanes sp. NPDC049599 TaxID=3363903 RepID=UPI0037B3FEC4
MWNPARLAAVLVLSAAAVLSPAAARAAAPATATAVAVFTRLAQWPAGYVGSITVRNDGPAVLDGWRVEFDLAAGTRVTSSYSGVFSHTGDHWTVTNETWNARLAPGSSATFGWVAEGQGTPAHCTLNGADCAGVPADHTAPTRPGPLVLDISSGLTLTWAPSTDDHGPVAYEVYESGQLRATVTDTRYVYSTGGTLPPRIYIFAVRAVDPAGNSSPLSYRTLGQIWRGDEVPDAPSDLRVETPAAGLLRLSWTAPVVPSPFATPPVAGYEVLVDGVPAGQVGGTSIILAAPPAGPHTLGVRTINAVDNTSAVTELSYPG